MVWSAGRITPSTGTPHSAGSVDEGARCRSRRRLLRRAAFAFAILLTLAVAALLFAPQLLDVNRLKAPIIDEIAAQTGYRFELAGPIRLSLLPSPAITARGVRLANPPGAAIGDMVRLRAVDVKLAFWPLLTGNVTVRRLVLVEPEIDLERLAD